MSVEIKTTPAYENWVCASSRTISTEYYGVFFVLFCFLFSIVMHSVSVLLTLLIFQN